MVNTDCPANSGNGNYGNYDNYDNDNAGDASHGLGFRHRATAAVADARVSIRRQHQ